MSKYFIAIFVLLMPFLGFTQKNTDTEQLLKEAADKAKSYKSINTEFNFIVENVQDNSKTKYKGELWVKNKKFKMKLDQSVTFSNGKIRWVYMTDVNEVNISNVIIEDDDLDPEDKFIIDPMSIFTIYEKGFKYSTSGSQQIDGKNYTVVSLSPDDLDKPYFKIKVWISDNKDYFSIKYFQKDGTRITLQLADFKTDIKIKDSFFEFDVSEYPDVEVVDLR